MRRWLPVPKRCQEIKKPVNLVIHEHEIIWTNRKYNGIIRQENSGFCKSMENGDEEFRIMVLGKS